MCVTNYSQSALNVKRVVWPQRAFYRTPPSPKKLVIDRAKQWNLFVQIVPLFAPVRVSRVIVTPPDRIRAKLKKLLISFLHFRPNLGILPIPLGSPVLTEIRKRVVNIDQNQRHTPSPCPRLKAFSSKFKCLLLVPVPFRKQIGILLPARVIVVRIELHCAIKPQFHSAAALA